MNKIVIMLLALGIANISPLLSCPTCVGRVNKESAAFFLPSFYQATPSKQSSTPVFSKPSKQTFKGKRR